MGAADEPLIPSRKAIAVLSAAPDRIELLLRWCPEKDPARSPQVSIESIRSLVGRLGTLDRHHYLEVARILADPAATGALPELEPPAGTGDAELADCELAELVTRFRHLRAQSVEFLEAVEDDAWERERTDPVLGRVTLASIVTHWVNHDAAALATLGEFCGALHAT
jgi:DinB superfamily